MRFPYGWEFDDLWRLPPVSMPRVKTLWPETAAEGHVDYKPEKNSLTYCTPIGRQIDEHCGTIDMVIEDLSSEVDRRIVWPLLQVPHSISSSKFSYVIISLS